MIMSTGKERSQGSQITPSGMKLTRFYVIVGVGLSLALFTYVYSWLWVFVGRFPAESLEVGRSDAESARALCYDPQNRSRLFSVASKPYGLNGPEMLAMPVITKAWPSPDIGLFADSRALFYSSQNGSLYALNQLGNDDRAHINTLSFWYALRPVVVRRFMSRIDSFSPTCNVPFTDRGMTEAYWSTKGEAVIHHWSFLYDASFSDGKPVHAQYGWLLSLSARRIAVALGLAGPTGFVRVAWWLYWAVGMLYVAAFLYVFRAVPLVAAVGLAGQIALFTSVGAFSILLAPGYHWTRELVMILPPLSLAVATRLQGAARRRGILVPAGLGMAVIADLIDPTFTLISVGCFALALAIHEQATLRRAAGLRPFLMLAAAVLVACAIAGVAITDRSNVTYIVLQVFSVGAAAFTNPGRTQMFLVDLALALIAIGLTWFRRLPPTAAYFALLSVVVYNFYVITPDEFHFYKYVEYTVPLFVSLGIAIFELLPRALPRGASAFMSTALFVGVLALVAKGQQNLTGLHPEWQLRLYNSFGEPYFISSRTTINGRIIDANLNADALARLRSFPAAASHDYIISPLDKYLIFLYDVHNGFDLTDATGWLNSDAKLSDIERAILQRRATLLLDSAIFEVNPLAALLSTHPILGNVNQQSVLNLKSRIRMNELGAFVVSHCRIVPAGSSREWFSGRC